MKIAQRLLPLLLVILAVIGIGCSHVDKTVVEDVITNELDLLKNLDSKTTQKYISYKELFPDAGEEVKLSDEVKEVFSLFFQDFDYKILDIDVDKDKKTATASIRLSTMDAHTLAKDFAASQLKMEILEAADADSQNTEDITISLEERYLILDQLLKTNEYDSVESNCTIKLVDKGDKDEIWEIKRTYSLENDLVGGLMTYLSDPDILSPEDTLAVYLKTLKKMDMEEMSNYLGVESILNTSDTAKNAIASALVEQVHKNFNYEVKESSIDGYNAVVNTEISTFDSDAILSAYQKELDTYLSSPDAVIDGSQKRYQKSHELLLDSIESNTTVKTAPAAFHFTNDGVSWKLKDESSELGNAIFGTLTTSPVEDGDDAVNEASEDTSEEYSEDDSGDGTEDDSGDDS
ncbi:hypothetical protein NXH76_01320 [Blautia schinkii]|nr:hypothetical protein [Blautia schinkii]